MSPKALFVIFAIALGLTVLFWGPLWQGYGLIGGDLYTYFFPQKLVYADQLAAGNVPLWNDLVGFGYPLLAESQAGVFYPPNPLLYTQFDVNTAYNISQIGHYVLAFVFTWLLLRRYDLSYAAATLGAIVFVYGWFPPRICLEWAIIGGVYFPLALWCVESFLQTSRLRWLVLLAASQGIHLLAGHFNLAFITQLTCTAYAGLRMMSANTDRGGSPSNGRGIRFALILAALACGFALAAVQILPTWELKQLSQREDVGAAHNPGYGHIPPWYLSQIVAPWLWYPVEMDPDQALQSIHVLTIPAATNKVEAHLYFGIVPLLLIGYRLLLSLLGTPLDRRLRVWLWLGLAAMVYATGWLIPVTQHLPGFSFFMGPGRYGIVTTMAAALLAGSGLDQLLVWLDRRRLPFRTLVIGAAIGLTLADLYWVSRRVTYAVMVKDPPIAHVTESEVRRLLTKYEAVHGPQQSVRMLAGGPNWASLTGFAAYPQYLGIGPAAYFDPALTMPEPTDDMTPADRTAARAAQRDWLRQGAFTHILSMEPLDPVDWPDLNPVWQGYDQVLNRVYARREPLYLYELPQPLPRFRLEGGGAVQVETAEDQRTVASITADEEGEFVWADLAYPGWLAHIETGGETQTVETRDGLFRTISIPAGASRITWKYDPASYRIGRIVSLTSLAMLLLVSGFVYMRRRGRADGAVATASGPSPRG